MRYVFADCELDTALYVLHRQGHSLRLRPKVFQTLLYLLEHRGEVVSKHDLIEAVWPDQYISEATLADVIRNIRRAVGDDARRPRVIRTRHGHGYHFAAEVTVVADPASDGQALAALTPNAPLGHDAQPPATGERKVVTVFYGSLGRSAMLSTQLGLDALYSLMRSRYERVQEIAQQYGGALHPLPGDRILVVFGAPTAHEDHARRAALAALAMRDSLRAQPQTDDPRYHEALAVSCGLHTGEVAVEVMGATPEPTAMLIGNVIAQAMALQEHAAPGTVLCSDATARLLQDIADLEPSTPISLPERSEPVMVYTLRAARDDLPSRHWSRPLSPFVGRQRELTTLEMLLARAQSGQGHAVVISGEPGIGKSRLLHEFHARLTPSWFYVSGECQSYGAASPYLPLLQMLRRMCAIAEADDAETIARKVSERLQQAEATPDLWSPPLLDLLAVSSHIADEATLSPQARKERIFAALLELCVRSSRQGPLLIEIENLHWIDATSEEWLTAFAERLAGHPILLLMTRRPERQADWLDAAHVTHLPLSGLSPEQSRQLLQAAPQAAQIAEPLARELLAKAEGNPFFLEELTRAVADHHSDHMPVIPDHVQAVLAARIDRLPTSEKHLLQMASVIGQDIPLPLLEGIATLPEAVLQQRLQHLRASGFLYEARFSPHLVYTFKHALTQEAAYQSLLASSRQPYHDQIAQLLLERFPDMAASQPERVAHHYTEAGRVEEALPFWQRAGEQAVARSADVEAIRHFTRGLSLLTHLPETTERKQLELGLQLALSGPLLITQGSRALGPIAQRVLELCQVLRDKAPYFSGLVNMWRFLFNTGQLHKAREIAEQCFALVQHTTDPSILLEAHTMLGSTFLILGELRTAHHHFQQGARLEAAQPPAQIPSQAVDTGVVCLSRQAQMLWQLGYADQASSAINRAQARAQKTRNAFSMVFARFHAGLIHQFRREFDALHEDAEAVIALAQEHGFFYYLASGQGMRGIALTAKGAPEAGLAKLQETLAAWQARGITFGLSVLYTVLAGLYLQCDQVEAGLQALDKASTFIRIHAERYYEAETYRLRGELLLHPSRDDPKQAETCFEQARDIAVRQHAKAWELRATMSLCRLWREQGRRQDARHLLEPVYNWFKEGLSTQDLLEARALLDSLCAA